MRTAVYIVAFIIISIAIAFTIRATNISDFLTKRIKNDNKKATKTNEGKLPDDLDIAEKWELPQVLEEISAISYIGENRFACIQDEAGTIFIYNTASEKIEKEIPFADQGDYEGLAVVGQDAYVLRADGQIFQVRNYSGPKPSTIEYKTHLTSKHDPEGMCYDPKKNRLLVAIKGSEPDSDDFKGIYSFDLKKLVMAEQPVLRINLKDKIFENIEGKKKGSVMRPSEIAIHPETGDIYITEGTKPKLLVMDSTGKIKTLKQLKNSDFNQPEGISFSPQGTMYISNEGSKNPGNILELKGM